jgi:hypothetical protein
MVWQTVRVDAVSRIDVSGPLVEGGQLLSGLEESLDVFVEAVTYRSSRSIT